MKKVIVLFLLIINIQAFGQTWIDSGAVWHYDWWTIGSGGFRKVIYTGDTLIENKKCQKLVSIDVAFYSDQFGKIHDSPPDTIGIDFTYVSGDTVFHQVNNKFLILYNFGAKPGDTWELGVDTNITICSKSIVIVDSIGTININNKNYRWISLSAKNDSSVFILGKVIERIGSVSDFLYPSNYFCANAYLETYIFTFHCFEDNTFKLYNPTTKDCEYYYDLIDNINNNQANNITISPNPSTHFIKINNSPLSIKSIEIIDNTGRLVLNQIIENSTDLININALDNGIYFIRIRNNNDQIYLKKIIKN